MTHASYRQRRAKPWGSAIISSPFSGIEDLANLKADLEFALSKAKYPEIVKAVCASRKTFANKSSHREIFMRSSKLTVSFLSSLILIAFTTNAFAGAHERALNSALICK